MPVNSSPKNGIFRTLEGLLPSFVIKAIKDELSTAGLSYEELFEIRLRKDRESSILLSTGTRALGVRLREGDMSSLLSALTGGALYAHRDTLCEGFISLCDGIRVGVCAAARYDGGKMVGVSEISAFIFRISHSRCDFAEDLYSVWRTRGSSGLLIYSPPGGGKTTAIRALSGMIGRRGKHVVAVDERCEFLSGEYEGAEVDILRGFKKAKGIEIAVRTLGAEIVVVDEIGSSEAESVLLSLTLGVPIIATVHARSAEEIFHGPAFLPFVKASAFDTLVGIRRVGGVWRISTSSMQSGRVRVKL